jgi:zinc protease
MNHRLLVAASGTVAILTALTCVLYAPPAQEKYLVLDNGLRVYLVERHNLPLIHIAAAVGAGVKDETDATSGLVHLLEHCVLFRGTERRSGSDVGREVRERGAYFNAHTGRDFSVFEISLGSADVEFGLRNQKEIIFDLDLRQEELDREKDVILEEISQLEDDPNRYARDLALSHLFAGHPYGRSVYGDREAIRGARAEDMRSFHDRYFVPANCGLAVVGDRPLAELERLITEIFGAVPKAEAPASSVPPVSSPAKIVEIREERDVKSGYLVLAFPAPDYNSPDQYAFELLAEVLGRGVSPLLNSVLHGTRDLAESVSMAHISDRFGGAALVSISGDPRTISSAEREAIGFLRRAGRENYGAEDYAGEAAFLAFDFLKSAKNQVRFAVEQSRESGLALASALARHMIVSSRPDAPSYLESVDRVRPSDLRRVASTYLGRGKHISVRIVPAKEVRK